MRVDAVELWSAVKNVSVYSKKDGWAQTVKVHHHVNGNLLFRTSDDYIGIESGVSAGTEVQVPDFYLSHDSIKELEKWLRAQKGELLFQVYKERLVVDSEDGPLVEAGILDCPDRDWWEMFGYIMGMAFSAPHDDSDGPFEVDPTRLSKLNLLEPKTKYPLSWKRASDGGKGVVAFKYGPSTYGVVMPLDREKLEEVYPNLDEVVW